MQKPGLLNSIAIILIILSCIAFGLIFVVPFLSLTVAAKGIFVTALVVIMEVAWWAGIAIVGKQVITKYKKFLDPRNWFSHEKDRKNDTEDQ